MPMPSPVGICALVTVVLGTLCLRVSRPGPGRRPTGAAAPALAFGALAAAWLCADGAIEAARHGPHAPEGLYSFIVAGAFLVTRWVPVVTKWHRLPGDGPSLPEACADSAGMAVAAAAQAALWSCALPWMAGRAPSAFLNAAFCVHAATLLGVWAWMRRFYPPAPGAEGRGSQSLGALWCLAGVGLLLGAFHLPLFLPASRGAVATAGAFGLGLVLVYCVELAWQPVEPPAPDVPTPSS